MSLRSAPHLRQTSGGSGVYGFATDCFHGLNYLAPVKYSVLSWTLMSEVVRSNPQITSRAIRPWRASVVVGPPVDGDVLVLT